MAIYVDRLLNHGWKYGKNCHLTADTEEELLAFAAMLGMKRSWLQVSRSGIQHFDLTAKRRELAVRLGAIEK